MSEEEQRIALLEKQIAALWKCCDELYSMHGRQSPRWAQRRDMALYFEQRQKAMASSGLLDRAGQS